jgi:DNA-binding response OmpR family regulator
LTPSPASEEGPPSGGPSRFREPTEGREDPGVRTILVADDELTIRTLLRTALEHRGHVVLEAGSATDVLKILDTHRPDVLLLDVHLGSEDGLALAAGLRRERQYDLLKIVIMSGSADEQEVVRLSRLWDVPILAKPFEVDALLEAIR